MSEVMESFESDRPLVVDLGCGLGSFTRGLLTASPGRPDASSSICGGNALGTLNALGVDLCRPAIRFAQAAADRSGLAGRCESAPLECSMRVDVPRPRAALSFT